VLFFFFKLPYKNSPLSDLILGNCLSVSDQGPIPKKNNEEQLLDWGAIYATHVFDEQVCLLTGFIDQLYDVCAPLRMRFVPDSTTPWMTVGLRDSIRERDAMNSRAVFNHAITCSVYPTMWKSVIVRLVVASPSYPSDFCPITIVSVLSKGIERLINGHRSSE
jgi:hypothetical protein